MGFIQSSFHLTTFKCFWAFYYHWLTHVSPAHEKIGCINAALGESDAVFSTIYQICKQHQFPVQCYHILFRIMIGQNVTTPLSVNLWFAKKCFKKKHLLQTVNHVALRCSSFLSYKYEFQSNFNTYTLETSGFFQNFSN